MSGVYKELRTFIAGDNPLCVVKAPPGSGKSYNLLEALEEALKSERRIAIAAQTNNQVNDLCQRFCDRFPKARIIRFSSSAYEKPSDMSDRVDIVSSTKLLPTEPSIIISTVAKYGLSEINNPYDVLFIDEAWQMTWADFLTIRDVSDRYVMIGDPGQIPPTVTISVDRWEVSPVAPHSPAPEVILQNDDLKAVTTVLNLDTCRRLPEDSVELVRHFYDFFFGSFAKAGERFLRPTKKTSSNRLDQALAKLNENSTVIYTHPTGADGVPVETDTELAEVVAGVAQRLLELKCVVSTSKDEMGTPRQLTPSDIGIVSTHNQMNTAIQSALPADLVGDDAIRVTTPERWQGLERAVMIAVHPLSGVQIPSAFDLETGRLCVMASRHKSACIFVTRDHVGTTLDSHLPSADQALGRGDIIGRGHAQHTAFWKYHEKRGLVV
jgi:AAA domain